RGCNFFFSSRRRHTRSTRDWSSDVCSSDLGRQCLGRLDDDVAARGELHALGEQPADLRLDVVFVEERVLGLVQLDASLERRIDLDRKSVVYGKRVSPAWRVDTSLKRVEKRS